VIWSIYFALRAQWHLLLINFIQAGFIKVLILCILHSCLHFSLFLSLSLCLSLTHTHMHTHMAQMFPRGGHHTLCLISGGSCRIIITASAWACLPPARSVHLKSLTSHNNSLNFGTLASLFFWNEAAVRIWGHRCCCWCPSASLSYLRVLQKRLFSLALPSLGPLRLMPRLTGHQGSGGRCHLIFDSWPFWASGCN
jgi:hypothetical protein